jgi:hypothetical protein
VDAICPFAAAESSAACANRAEGRTSMIARPIAEHAKRRLLI